MLLSSLDPMTIMQNSFIKSLIIDESFGIKEENNKLQNAELILRKVPST